MELLRRQFNIVGDAGSQCSPLHFLCSLLHKAGSHCSPLHSAPIRNEGSHCSPLHGECAPLRLQKVLFLDRDGTICDDGCAFHSNNYERYEDLINNIEIIDGVKEALKYAKDKGYIIVVISNQAGVAKGKFLESDVQKFNNELNKKLDFMIDGFYYCIHHPDGDKENNLVKELIKKCDCRKPEAGMFFEAEKDLRSGKIRVVNTEIIDKKIVYIENREELKKEKISPCEIDKENSFMVGDKIDDCRAGKKYGIKSFLVRTGEGEKQFEKEKSNIDKETDGVFENLVEVIYKKI